MIADLYHEIHTNNTIIDDQKISEKYWKSGFKLFLEEADTWPTSERDWWLECIADIIRVAGRDPNVVLGEEFCLSEQPSFGPTIPMAILLLKGYISPLSFGTMGHSLTSISRTIFHEYGVHVRGDKAALLDQAVAFSSARTRYVEELAILEKFLAAHGHGCNMEQLDKERSVIDELTKCSSNPEEVEDKARIFEHVYIPHHVMPRIERLRGVADQTLLFERELPEFLSSSKCKTMKEACRKVQAKKCWKDSTEDALMTLSTRNWKAKKVPACENLPEYKYQTVCRMRDDILKQVGEAATDEMMLGHRLRHRHSFRDFASFLIMTAVLHNAVIDKQKMCRSADCYCVG
jgi:hypothetical protein